MQSHIKVSLEFKCIIGLLDFERIQEQKVLIELEAKSKKFLDYAKLCARIEKIYKKKKFKTIEKSLKYICKDIKKHHKKLQFINITCYKPDIIKNARVGASLSKKY
ncbi:FolB domain-containing protein [Campylobacter lari]|uniref:FolB domain-containing protein n=1 Tax=Campylobacter lari TaxID=201 RepID=A0A7U8BHH7_CAMLA|nr:FolB domain-containing protein [Campylobacter lari]EAK9857293.1 FolB domain-containing protein [Campylobacter lari]ELP9119713.1 dihydroneopterin aldolase [Campylobacter lari]